MSRTVKGPNFFLHYLTSYEEQVLTLFTPMSGGCIHLAYQTADPDSKLWEYCQYLLPTVLNVATWAWQKYTFL